MKPLKTKKPKPITYQEFMLAREIAEKQPSLFSYSSVTTAPLSNVDASQGTSREMKVNVPEHIYQRG